MKAIVIEKFGGPDVLEWREVPTPEPVADEVRVRISHTSVNPVDWKIREGYLRDVLPHQFPLILGWDLAGVVEALGPTARGLKVGDRVFGYCRKPTVQFGTYAEYACVSQDALALLPEGLSFAEGAAIPLVALTAWQTLERRLQLTKGDTILITGGAGGVGSLAIQMARRKGATVLSTASFANHQYLRELGAAYPLEYGSRSVSGEVRKLFPLGIDAVLDCVGGNALNDSFACLRSGGRLVSIVDNPDPVGAKRAGVAASYHFVEPSGSELTEVAAALSRRELLVPAIEEMRLVDAKSAQLKNQTRHVRGKIVLRV